MGWTDDPLADYAEWETEQEAQYEKLPKCDECGEAIEDEYLFDFGGDILCEDCMCRLYRKSVDDYIE